MSILTINKLLVHSPNDNKSLFTEFSDSVNIIHGRNTSGKSTLIQSIIYALGINDSKENLNEINTDGTFFRLDCTIRQGNEKQTIKFVRSGDTITIKEEHQNPKRFDGINSNNSYEYERYKKELSKILDFNLLLQKQSELVPAPLEAALLPFYISQSVGWVYIRESIGDFRFYKEFKNDYLDYYCGIENSHERVKKYNLEKERNEKEFELSQLESYKNSNIDLITTEEINNQINEKNEEYLKNRLELHTNLSEAEEEHSRLCNKLSLLRARYKIISRTIKNISTQRPQIDNCPACHQTIPGSIESNYTYHQDKNNLSDEKLKIKKQINNTSTAIISTEKKLNKLRESAKKEILKLKKLKQKSPTFENWINHHANIKLLENISKNKEKCIEQINNINIEIKKITGEKNHNEYRQEKELEFLSILIKKSSLLDAKLPKEEKFRSLYSLNSFPYQGVELHKLLIAYNFAFYEMISNNSQIHKLPFLLDAIFKEDIDLYNRSKIFEFLSKETKSSGQVIFSVAEHKMGESSQTSLFNIEAVKENYFPTDTKLICIGDSRTKRAFLSSNTILDPLLLDESISLIESI